MYFVKLKNPRTGEYQWINLDKIESATTAEEGVLLLHSEKKTYPVRQDRFESIVFNND